MYLWKTKLLARDLKEDKVTEKEYFKYFVMYSLIWCICVIIYRLMGKTVSNGLFIIDNVLEVLNTMIPIIVSYNVNKKGNNKDFLKRYISISCPLSIKFFILAIIVSVIPLAIGLIFNKNFEIVFWVAEQIFIIFVTALLTWRYLVHFKFING